ncbi:MAG TPA: hypothetical protein ENL43_03545 [candidate division WOR-3 bacterium]|uniref:Uncharacterized protein n=1 Tax=candidate division WOR-3 bacterium TaxID=2052148 RepID=A0A7V5HPC3_UNCW3|nr:hypothetical protein [candidate division WOR-3 bacterium]
MLILLCGLIVLMGCQRREAELDIDLLEAQDTVRLIDPDQDLSNSWLSGDSTVVKDSVYIRLRAILHSAPNGFIYEIRWRMLTVNDSVLKTDRGIFSPEIYLEEEQSRNIGLYIPVDNYIAYGADLSSDDTLNYKGSMRCEVWVYGATPYEYVISDTLKFWVNFTLD